MTITGADNKVGTELTASVTGNTHILFQFTPLREGRPLYVHLILPARVHFNSRPCERGDFFARPLFHSFIISIHAPARGATALTVENGLVHRQFQFTPLREGRRQLVSSNTHADFISIHAPARGATWWKNRLTDPIFISIHAPARGATDYATKVEEDDIFQFTPLREGRPTKQAVAEGKQIFQFTPLREGRPSSPLLLPSHHQFQFTPLREGRQ